MALKFYAYIFVAPDFDPNKHSTEANSPTCRVKFIGIDINKKEAVIPIAKKLVEEGVQLIEVCGGFGPTWIARIIEATGGKVPVGGVFYGPEARKPMLDILTSP